MFRWLYRDIDFSIDAKQISESMSRQKELESAGAVTTAGIHPSPVMHLVQHACGLETAIYLMADEPALFREVVDLMHRAQLREMRALLPHVVADTFWLTENTSTTLLSPAMFREFCLGHLVEYGDLILEHGIIPVHHMCGTLNALLEMIDGLPAVANEAYTTRPLGDVSLAEGRSRMPSKTLIGGTNATLWLEPVEAIVETVRRDLEACPDRRKIFLTSAGVLPPPVSFEKARAVVGEFKRL
jgi:uroporphyrinogen-III decarboxylase